MLRKLVFLTLAVLLLTAMVLPIATPTHSSSSNAQIHDNGGSTIASVREMSRGIRMEDPTCPPNQPGTCG
jgi:hypothetical protein